MPDTREHTADAGLDYDPEDAERIERLLEEARQHPERKAAVYEQLDHLIFGLHAED